MAHGFNCLLIFEGRLLKEFKIQKFNSNVSPNSEGSNFNDWNVGKDTWCPQLGQVRPVASLQKQIACLGGMFLGVSRSILYI